MSYRLRIFLFLAFCCGVIAGPLIWSRLPLQQAFAQEEALSLVLVPSASTVRPNQQVSVSAMLRVSSQQTQSVSLHAVLSGAGRLLSATTNTGTCATSDTTASCTLAASAATPAQVVFQLLPSANANGSLLLELTATSATDQKAQAVTIRVAGQAEPSATPTATATKEPTGNAATQTPIVITATPSATNDATRTPEPTHTPVPLGYGPDRCEPNDTLVQPCALQTEVDIGDLNFTDGMPDVFSFLLKGGRTYTIRASSSSGIDPSIAVYLAGALDTPIAQNDDAAAGSTDAIVQVTTATDAWYIVRVANAAPGDMTGKTYSISARSSAPTDSPTGNQPAPTPQPWSEIIGDAFENNWSPEFAPRLAWGVPYDLSLVCPDPGRCANGDHDFFWIPVKSGIPLVVITYDLGAGADTYASLYSPAPEQQDETIGPKGWRPLVANDDAAPGWTLRSQLEVTPNWDGYALLVIAPSNRADPPAIPESAGPPARYRLMVGSPEMAAVNAVLSAQTDGPPIPSTVIVTAPPTSQAVAAPVENAPVADQREVVKESSMEGLAVVIQHNTSFYAAVPPTEKDLLSFYPEGAQVRLLGQTYAGYVKVQPSDSVAPGWMYAPNLRPLSDPHTSLEPTTGAGEEGGESAKDDQASTGSPQPTRSDQNARITATSTSSLPRVGATERSTPASLPTSVQAQPQARQLTIEVCREGDTDPRQCGSVLRDVAVEVLLASSQTVLATGRTDRTGLVSLSVSLAPHAQIVVRVPSLTITVPVLPNQTRLPIRIPQGASDA
jgi:hypothetical protein